MNERDLRKAIGTLPKERLEMMAFSVYALRRKQNDPLRKYKDFYYTRPLDWIDAFVEVSLPRYLRKAFGAIQDGARKIALIGPHGIGKTVFGSLLILWCGSVSEDCKIPTTASAWRQLTHFLWPEIHKWSGRVNWQKIGFQPTLLTRQARFYDESEAFAVACTNPATIEGAHALRVAGVYDEAKSIPRSTWDAMEGAFSSPGHHLQIAMSTPGEAAGKFYDICAKRPGNESWTVIQVSLRDAIRAGRISMPWARERRREWMSTNPVYINRVWGKFAEESSDTLIPLAWIYAAVNRWHAWKEAGGVVEGIVKLGADVSRGGRDRTAFAYRYKNVISKLDYYSRQQTADTMVTVGRIMLAIGNEGIAKPDVIGIGSGIVDRLKEQIGSRCIPINAAESVKCTDRTGTLGFVNLRSAMWWGLRERLDPETGDDLCLPDDPDLIGDLSAPKWKPTSGGKIAVESKDSIRERIGRSTDAGDAVAQVFFDEKDVKQYVTVG